MLISPSILASDFSRLAEEVKSIENAGADLVHIDVMDGMFVPNITLGAPVITCLKGKTTLPFDVHLMINEPARYIDDFAKAGADIITFHIEATDDVKGTIEKIKNAGIKPALSIKPGTAAESVFPYLDDLYMVLVMTVEPGFGGQSFMPDSLDKVRELKAMREEMGLDFIIEIDGGISAKNAAEVFEAGCDAVVAGSAVFCAPDPEAEIVKILNA